MRFVATKWIATAILSISAFGLASASTEAEACCGFFRNLFGCCGGCGGGGCGTAYYGPRMSPCGPAGCGTTYSSYGRCAPCGSGCSPCATGAPCSSGNCGVSIPASGETIAPNENWQKAPAKTYSSPDPSLDLGAPRQIPAEGTSAFKAGKLPGSAQGFKPIPGINANGATSQATEPAANENKKGPPAKKADADEGSNSGKRPAISVDDKVASRGAPLRTRVEVRSHVGNAGLVRVPAYPKSDWIPVESEPTVARK